jgi:rubrerythrin
LELLIGKPSTKECLEKAIEGENYEWKIMYPNFQSEAKADFDPGAESEFREQGLESREHSQQFENILKMAERRFAALTKIEKRHAAAYQQVLETM